RVPDRGDRGRARLWFAGRGLVCPDTAGCVPRCRVDECPVCWPAAAAIQHGAPGDAWGRLWCVTGNGGGEHPRRPCRPPTPAQALPVVLLDPRGRRQHAPLLAGHPRLPACLLSYEECGLEAQQALSLAGMER